MAEVLIHPKCRECGCTDADCSQCIAKTGAPCSWVEADLCSACAPAPVDLIARSGDVAGDCAAMLDQLADAWSEVARVEGTTDGAILTSAIEVLGNAAHRAETMDAADALAIAAVCSAVAARAAEAAMVAFNRAAELLTGPTAAAPIAAPSLLVDPAGRPVSSEVHRG